MVMRLRAVSLMVLVSLLVVMLVGCGKPEYLGKYYNEYDESLYIELKDDNVLVVNRGDSVMEGTYKINGENITLTLMGMQTWGKIFGKMILDPDGTAWYKK